VFDADTLSSIVRIILIDLVLSGDNAVVIGMAAARLSLENRRRAILIGGGLAIALRIIFTVAVALLLGIPLLQAVGGLMLLYIAYKLIQPAHESANITEADTLAQAIRTIVLADVVMSLDNILAVGGAAEGHLWLLLFGLALSIPLLLVGSEMVARLLHRLPILLYVGVLVLVHTAIHMFNDDDLVEEHLVHIGSIWVWVLAFLITAGLTLGVRWRRSLARTAHRADVSPT
jgi:YjbE family integral membrane protein